MIALAGPTLEATVRPERMAHFKRDAPLYLDSYVDAERANRLGLWSNAVPPERGNIVKVAAVLPKVYW